ncbi:phosphoenolpyruvate--protein phosphotransferase [Treponema primitia]|uniref:phosphoenolpyruvate--protein phosphotransferase n=1 Tax=Treponema primitia TaxID=88058 RepID=UPI00397FF210
MKVLTGLTASPGIASGKVYLFTAPALAYDPTQRGSPAEEEKRLEEAYAAAFGELENIKNTLSKSLGEEFGHIFRAQMTMLEDDDFKQEIADRLKENTLCAEAAVEAAYSTYGELFAEMAEDSYNIQRLADLNDICKRILRNLLGVEEVSLSSLPPGSIVVAEELFPSDTAMMDRENIRGFVTEKGGLTSHVAILAKSLSLPAVVGTPGILNELTKDDTLALDVRDFEQALVYINPDSKKREEFAALERAYYKRREELMVMKDLEPVTLDGKKITLSANIGSVEDLINAQSYGAKGVGLFRTEFLFLRSATLPNEEEQYKVYAEAVKKLNGGMLIIRTLDIGGDKEVKALVLPKEENPFLGLRGIRLCLKHEDLFLTQLRALLRAAVHGDIRIMFPMVSAVAELRQAKALIDRAAADLKSRGIPHRPDPPLGVMVETPAAVFLADELTREGSFVSMGTNDLTQYLLSVDRGNEEISAYYRTFSPAILRAIGMTARAARKNGKWAGVCGELASNPLAIPVLIGLGVDELSVTAQFLPQIIAQIRSLNYSHCRELAEKAAAMATQEEVKVFLKKETYT